MLARIVLVLLISTVASAADAQTKPRVVHTAPRRAQPIPRGYVLGGVSFLFGDGDFTDHRVIKTNAEDGSFDASYTNPNATGFDVAGGIRLWKYLGARIGVSHYSSDSAADVALSVPHPFFFQRPRTLSSCSGWRSAQRDVGPRACDGDIRCQQAPATIGVWRPVVPEHDARDDHRRALHGRVPLRRHHARSGAHDGEQRVTGDVRRRRRRVVYFTKTVGVAGTIEFASANSTFATASGGSVTMTSGGPRVGVGLSIRFR